MINRQRDTIFAPNIKMLVDYVDIMICVFMINDNVCLYDIARSR